MSRETNWILIVVIAGVMAVLAVQQAGKEPDPVANLSQGPSQESTSTDSSVSNSANNSESRSVSTASSSSVSPSPSPQNVIPTSRNLSVENQDAAGPVNTTSSPAVVEDLRSRLNQLQDQAQEISASLDPNERQTLQSSRQEIGFILQSLSNQEEEIHRRTQDALANQSSSYQYAYQELEKQIQEQRQIITQTQNEIANWERSTGYTDLRESTLTDLNTVLAQQIQQLNELRQQRLGFANSILYGRQTIQVQREQALNQVQQQRSTLQRQSQSLAEEINQRQRQAVQQRSELIRIQEQIKETQQALQREEGELQNLQNTTE